MKRNPYLLLGILFLFLLLQNRSENKRMVMNDSLFKTIVVDPLEKRIMLNWQKYLR